MNAKRDRKRIKDLNPIYRQMGQRLLEYRRSMHRTQAEMAEAIGLSKNYYGETERGKHGLSLERLVILDEELGVDIYYILTGKRRRDFTYHALLKRCPRAKRDKFAKTIECMLEMLQEP